MRTVVVNERRTMIAGLMATFVFAACAGTPTAPVPADAATQEAAAVTRSVLTDAIASAKSYGQAHLGHYLHLNLKRLQREGLEVPESVSLTVRTKHNSFCIKAVNEDLPSIHPWAVASVASVTSGETVPSSQDGCKR